MAYSGSGTQASPYVVDNWADFVTVLNLGSNTYIKWADKADPSQKVVPPVTISSSIPWKAIDVDFNGWTFEQISVTMNRSAGTAVFTHNVSSAAKVYNWHVEVWAIKDFREPMFNLTSETLTIYNCYFDSVQCDQISSSSDYWTNNFSTAMEQVFTYGQWRECVIKIYTENISMIVPMGTFYNSEIWVNYKYDMTTGTTAVRSKNAIFQSTYLENSYLGGTIDVSDGSGSFAITNPKKSGGTYPVCLRLANSICNIKFLISEDCYINQYGSNQTIAAWTGNVKSYFVIDNGNNYSNLASVPQAFRCAQGDIKNPNKLTSDSFPYIADDNTRYPQYGLDNDSQTWTWRRQLMVNSGIPFLPFWFYPTYTPPEYSGAVDENPYITIFDMETKQTGFTGHGLAILRPTSCRIVEELNGEYNLTLTHPRDDEGRWQYLLEFNIIKALGQLFVIQKVDEVQTGGSAYVQAYAEHITYTLNDKWLFPPFTIAGTDGQVLIDSILALATDMGGEWQTQYGFDVTTDIDADPDFRDWYDMSEGTTPYEMLLGSEGFISKLGGELYRDNFTMKINERMYGAQDNAFEIAVGYNLTGIRRTVDLSTFCTYFRGYDVSDSETAYQAWFAVSWDPSTLPRAYPRNIVRSENFSYDLEAEFTEGRLERDTMTFFNQNCAPLISYELNVIDLKRNPDYKEFTNNYRYKVGDKGKVWDERLQSWVELEITRTEKDGITGECTKVVIGTQRSFTRPNGYIPSVPRVIIPNAEMIIEGVPPLEFNSNGDNLLEWYLTGAAGGVGDSSNLHSGGIDTKMYNPGTGEYLPNVSGWISSVNPIEVSADTEYTFSTKYMPKESIGLFTYEYDADMNFIGAQSTTTSASLTCRTWTTSSTTKYIRCSITGLEGLGVSDFGDFNLNLGGEQLPYTPYGTYTIPVTISDGTNSQTVNIPVSQPLTAGEVVSRASTNIDIPTYQGDNTLTVNTSVQPSSVKIKYKEG